MRDETSSVRALTEGEGEGEYRQAFLAFCPPSSWLVTRSSMHKFHACISRTNVLVFFYSPFSRFFFKLKTRYFGKKKGEDISLLFSRKDFFVRFVSFFFFFNDSKRCYCSIVVIFHRLPCSVRDIFTKHFGFMKWDTKAFRSMGLVHVYTR